MEEYLNINNLEKEFLLEELHKSIVVVGNNLYIDHFLCQNYFFDIDPFGETTNNAFINLQYKTKVTLYRKYLKEKDYDSVLNILDKQKKMEWFIKHHKKIYSNIGNTKYFKMFSWILTYIDHHYPYRKNYSKIIKLGRNPRLMMSKNEKELFNKLPQIIKIYRGVCVALNFKKIEEAHRELLIGNSWTLDYEKASWFSKNHAPKFHQAAKSKKIILSYEIDKKDVIAYFKERNEEEIFVDYKKIKLSEVEITNKP